MPTAIEFIKSAFEAAPPAFAERDSALAFLAVEGEGDEKFEAAETLLAEVAEGSDCAAAWDGLIKQRLALIERAFLPLLETNRDHVLHSAHLYLLGTAIYLEMIRNEPALCAVLAESYYRDIQAFHSDASSSYYCHTRLTEPNASLSETRQSFPVAYDLGTPEYRNLRDRMEICECCEVDCESYLPACLDDVDAIFRRCWGQAAILHDAAYPMELSVKLLQEYLESTVAALGCTVCCSKNLFSLEITRLCDIVTVPLVQTICGSLINPNLYCDNSLTMIATNIRNKLHLEYGVDTLQRLIRETFESSISEGRLDHGTFSALLMLKWINDALRKRISQMGGIASELAEGIEIHDRPDRRITKAHSSSAVEFFYIECVDAAAAVYLHTAKTRVSVLKDRKLDFRDHPYAWLLFLCDELQEWSRPSGKPGGPHHEPEEYSIHVLDVGAANGPVLHFDYPGNTDAIKRKLQDHLTLFGTGFVKGVG